MTGSCKMKTKGTETKKTHPIVTPSHICVALHKIFAENRFDCNSLQGVNQLLSKLSEESVDVFLTARGLNISKSLFIPCELFPESLRTALLQLIDEETPTYIDMMDNDERQYIMKYNICTESVSDKIGLVNLLCALFLCLKQVFGDKSLFNNALFDQILQLALNGRQIPYTTVIESLKEYGYSCEV